MKNIFDINHTKKVGETYWQHFTWCMYSAKIFAILLPLAIIHGIFPFLFPNKPDEIVIKWLAHFRHRRQLTGQADLRPEINHEEHNG